MNRRDFIVLAGAAAAFPRVAFAQQAARKSPRVALVTGVPVAGLDTPSGVATFNAFPNMVVFLTEMARLGYVEGSTVVYDRYSAPAADLDRVAHLVVASAPDLILSYASSAVGLAMLPLTTTIPILVGTADPISSGVVSNLSPTGRNLAAVSGTAGPDFEAANLALLAEAVPAARHAAYVLATAPGPLIPAYQAQVAAVTNAAAKLGLSLAVIIAAEAGDEPAFRDAFAQAKGAAVDAMQFGRNAQVGIASALLAQLTSDYRMPAISGYPAFTRAGGLMSYAQPDGDQYKKVAQYAALILQGTNPGTLPVVQPETFDLTVNVTTARSLDLVIPSSILARATQVIE